MKMPFTSATILYATLGAVSLAAFGMSFQALAELATANEMALPWAFPCIIDLAAIACAVASYQASTTGREEWGYRCLVVAFTLISGALNVSHVWTGPEVAHVLKYAMHALPPLVSFAIFEVLISEVRSGGRTATRAKRESHYPGAENASQPEQPRRR
jgi:hypothetical protein